MGSRGRKEVVEGVREQWRSLWQERIDDKVRAEGIASKDYGMLFVERGTVIFATRDFKPVRMREVLEQHDVVDVDRVVSPNPHVGGWGKFVRTKIVTQKSSRRVEETRRDLDGKKRRQQLKKGGKGWLHY